MLRAVFVRRVMFVPELEVQIAVLETGAVEAELCVQVAQAGTLIFVAEGFAACVIVSAPVQARAISYLAAMAPTIQDEMSF